MFNKSKADTMDTVIGADTTIEGKILTDASLRIEGKVFGEVHCQGDVTIGEGGIVETIVSARNIIIAGTVRGNITASGKLHLLATGKFSGNAKIASLIIDEGAYFEGESNMNADSTSDKSVPIDESA